MGLGNVIINVGWKLVVVAVYAGVYELTPLRIPSDAWWAWVALFFADDLAFYWYHRVSHEVRVFWGSHVVHHSSQYFNLSTALRQPWVPMTAFPFWIPAGRGRLRALDDPAPAGDQPHLPVLHPHRASAPAARADRGGAQHALPSSRPPRLQRDLPRPQLRRHPDHLGPAAGHLPGRDRAGPLWPDQEHRHPQPRARGPARIRGHMARHAGARSGWRHRLGVALHGPGWTPPEHPRPRTACATPAMETTRLEAAAEQL